MPILISDLTKPKYQALVELINHDNGTNYQVEDFMFDLPEALVNEPRNTQMTIYGVNPPLVTGQVTVRYNRPHIGSLPGVNRLSVYLNNRRQFSEIIDDINTILGTHLEEGDYVNETLPDMSSNPPGTFTTVELYMTQDNPVLTGMVEVLVHN